MTVAELIACLKKPDMDFGDKVNLNAEVVLSDGRHDYDILSVYSFREGKKRKPKFLWIDIERLKRKK